MGQGEVAEHLRCSLMLLGFSSMRSGSQQWFIVANGAPFTAIPRVEIAWCGMFKSPLKRIFNPPCSWSICLTFGADPGGRFDGCWFPTFVHFAATSCNK
jgi:hypothetical protein